MAGRSRFGKYELVARLAKGGMGETFRAELVAAQGVVKPVVIKKMPPDVAAKKGQAEAFIQEARLSATLTHSNIAQVLDCGEVDGEYFVAMEYVDGRSLESVMKRAQAQGWARLPFQLSVFVVTELLKGLHYAHTRASADGKPLNLVHRDLSPDDVLLGFEGEVKLVDFGVTKSTMEAEPGVVKGRFRYLSPEQAIAKPLDARSDLFTAGVMLYQLVTGDVPFAGEQHTVMQAIVKGDYVAPRVRAADVPEPISRVIERALQPARDQRFGSAQEMLEPLARWLYGQSPDFSGAVLRELLGQLFDGDLLKDGRLFVSQPTARAKLAGLAPGREGQPALQATIQPEQPAVERSTSPAVPAAPTQSSSQLPAARRRPPVALLGLAGVLSLAAVGVIGFEVVNSDRPEGLAASEVTALPPMPPGSTTQLAQPVGTPEPEAAAGAQVLDAKPEVTFDAEAAPVSFKLTKAHQVVVPNANCVELGKRWRLEPGDVLRVGSAAVRGGNVSSGMGVTKKNSYVPPAHNLGRTLPLLALFQGAKGAPQIWAVTNEITGADEGKVCAFGLTDRSLEQQLGQGARVKINGVDHPLFRAVVNVEPDDRYQVRSFPPGKSWVVRVRDVSPPWPVLFVTDQSSSSKPVVLDQKETMLKSPKSVWVTVPVFELHEKYSRTVSIELAPGEKLKESATDLMALARTEYDRRDYGDAARTLDKCVNAYPAFPACHLMLGATFAQLGYSEDAKAQYLEFLRLAPEDPEAPAVRKIVDDYEKRLGQ